MTEPRERRRITAADLVGLETPTSTAIAPDGSRVVFCLTETDFARSEVRAQLHVTPEPGKPEGERGDQRLTYGLSDAHAPSWSPDGSLLAFTTFRPQPFEDEEDDAREDGGEKLQVFLLPSSGGEARRLTERAEGVEIFRWSPDGKGVYTLGEAGRPSAELGHRRRRRDVRDDGHVVCDDIPRWEIWYHPLEGDAERILGGLRGVDDFDVSPDARFLAYATNHTGRPEDSEKSEIIVFDLETRESYAASAGRGGCESGPRFARSGHYLFFAGWSDPGLLFSRQEVFAIDLFDRSAPAKPLLGSLDRDVEEYLPLPDGRVGIAVAWGLENRIALVDPATGAHELLDVEGFNLGALSCADDGTLALVAESPSEAPEVALASHGAPGLRLLTRVGESCEDWIRARRERVVWENEGYEHEGLLLLPPEDGTLPPPVLVWIHGGPHWRVQDTFRVYEAEALAAEGWAVFLPQYRGSSGQGQDYATAVRGDLGGADARDVLAGLDAIVRRGLVDGGRAAVAGASYGGYLTNWLLATTKRFRAGVSIAGIFDLAQDYASSDAFSWEEHYLGGAPWQRPELYRERSPLTHASGLEAPVLILQGLEDDNTLFTNSKGLYRALVALGRTAEFVLYPREGHGFSEPLHRLDAATRILDWLARHILGREVAHVSGREVGDGVVRLVPLGHQLKKEISGVRPAEGRTFLEVSILVEALDGGPDFLRLVPCGGSSDVVLVDRAGDVQRPIGLPLDVYGQQVLFCGRGSLEAWGAEAGQPPSLPATVVFEVPLEPRVYELRVSDLPPVLLDVRPDFDDDEIDDEAAARRR